MNQETTDICLVQMPYGAIQRPSIALGLLKAGFENTEIRCQVVYANIAFAEQIGVRLYRLLETSVDLELMAEWTFAGAAFPTFQPDHSEFLNRAEVLLKRQAKVMGFAGDENFQKQLTWVREQAIAFIDNTARQVLDLSPFIVGCSSTFQQHVSSLALLKRIRQLSPQVITILGGGNCEGEMGVATKKFFPWVDFVVSGEADLLFYEFCSKLLQNGRDIPAQDLPYGVIGAQTPDSAIPPRAVVDRMDKVPMPDYDDYFKTLRASAIASSVSPGLLIETSRGCWWGAKHHCTFCGVPGMGMQYRSKSPGRAVEEFDYLSGKYGMRNFEVIDNILDMKYFKTVLPMLPVGDDRYSIFFETKANLSYEEMKILADSGVQDIQPGIESLHDSTLKLLDKGNTTCINIQTLKWARELGIKLHWIFLMNIPGELDEWYREMAEMIPLLTHLQPALGVIPIQYHRFSPYHQRPQEYGLDLHPLESYFRLYPLPEKELSELAYLFEDKNDVAGIKCKPGPGVKAFLRERSLWQRVWNNRTNPWFQNPRLSMIDDGERITITDTRSCAVQSKYVLEGLRRLIYRACLTANSPERLIDAHLNGIIETQNQVSTAIKDLLDKKIMMRWGNRLLSLAVREPIPLLHEKWPGGELFLTGL